jgi:hypothetical protein
LFQYEKSAPQFDCGALLLLLRASSTGYRLPDYLPSVDAGFTTHVVSMLD